MGLGAGIRTATGLGIGMLAAAAAATLRTVAVVATGLADLGERQVSDLLGVRFGDEVRSTRALSAPRSGPGTRAESHQRLESAMSRLLDLASDQSTSEGRQFLFSKLLDQLVPDEARIISALSDGSSSPLVHVRPRSFGSPAAVTVVENMSLVGRTANLTMPQQTPGYVSHLRSLGLVEIGPEDPSMKQEYEILLAEMAVLAAIKRASRRGMGARVERRTLRLSSLGRDLWAAAGDGAGGSR